MNDFQDAYKLMCLVSDGDTTPICTSADNDVTFGQKIVLSSGTPIVTKVVLTTQFGVAAQIADLSICYKGTVKRKIKLNIVLSVATNNK